MERVLVLGEDVLSQKRRLSEPPVHYNQTYSCRAKFYSMRFINQNKIKKTPNHVEYLQISEKTGLLGEEALSQQV